MPKKTIVLLALFVAAVAFGQSSKDQVASNEKGRSLGIKMLDANNGWADIDGAEGFRLLRTGDGGSTWRNVTPSPLPEEFADACMFPSSQTAWISVREHSLHTADGGKTWAQVDGPLRDCWGGSDCRFYDANHGVAKLEDGGAGSIDYNFVETRDGGITWKPVEISSPDNESGPNIMPGTIHLSLHCGDGISYQPPGNVVVTRGELGEEQQPAGVVSLSVTNNLGKTWRDLKLPLPAKYAGARNEPFAPFFFDEKSGLLPVQVFRTKEDDTYGEGILTFYATADGGNTWTARPGIIRFQERASENDYDIVSPGEIVVYSGTQLFASRDRATWQKITPKIDFTSKDSQKHIVQIDFVDATHGWIVISDDNNSIPYGNDSLYKTTDGGRTWAEVSLEASH